MNDTPFSATEAEAEAMRRRLARIAFPASPEEKVEAEVLSRHLLRWDEMNAPIVYELQIGLLDGEAAST